MESVVNNRGEIISVGSLVYHNNRVYYVLEIQEDHWSWDAALKVVQMAAPGLKKWRSWNSHYHRLHPNWCEPFDHDFLNRKHTMEHMLLDELERLGPKPSAR